jgi:hypothetical protein
MANFGKCPTLHQQSIVGKHVSFATADLFPKKACECCDIDWRTFDFRWKWQKLSAALK